jgi:two-component system vancomycin resistance associated response regulator VraR
MKVKLVLYDAYALALRGMKSTIKSIQDFEIVGAFTEMDDLVQCLKHKNADIVIMDLMLKSSLGLEAIGKIKNVKKEIKIIVLIEAHEKIIYKRALEMGVNAFLQKDTSDSELINCIISVAKGNAIVPDFLVEENNNAILSDIELEVLKLVSDEYTNDKIAKKLYIGKRTVETHVTNICRKLGVDSRVGAVREAIRLELIQ